MDNINYEAEVKKVYPDAVCRPVYYPDSGDWQIVIANNNEIGFDRRTSEAWKAAYNHINSITKTIL